jgi:hypothetical protein
MNCNRARLANADIAATTANGRQPEMKKLMALRH